MAAPSEDLINRLQRTGEELRALITEAHQAHKDLKNFLKEVSTVVDGQVNDVVVEMMQAEIKRQLDQVQFNQIGDGLKASLAHWNSLLKDAAELLDTLEKWRKATGIPKLLVDKRHL